MVIPAGQFKAKCLKLIDTVCETREEITITKRGKVCARLVPPKKKAKRPSVFGCMKGTGRILGDIISPIDVEWEAMK